MTALNFKQCFNQKFRMNPSCGILDWTSEFWWDEATTHKEYGERIAIDRQNRESLLRIHFWQET